MSVRTRLEKLEKATVDESYALIFINDGETQEEAYQRYFPIETMKTKRVIYLDEGDKLI